MRYFWLNANESATVWRWLRQDQSRDTHDWVEQLRLVRTRLTQNKQDVRRVGKCFVCTHGARVRFQSKNGTQVCIILWKERHTYLTLKQISLYMSAWTQPCDSPSAWRCMYRYMYTYIYVHTYYLHTIQGIHQCILCLGFTGARQRCSGDLHADLDRVIGGGAFIFQKFLNNANLWL